MANHHTTVSEWIQCSGKYNCWHVLNSLCSINNFSRAWNSGPPTARGITLTRHHRNIQLQQLRPDAKEKKNPLLLLHPNMTKWQTEMTPLETLHPQRGSKTTSLHNFENSGGSSAASRCVTATSPSTIALMGAKWAHDSSKIFVPHCSPHSSLVKLNATDSK